MAYNPEEDIKVSDLPEKTTDVVGDDKLLVIDSEDANILKQVDASKVGGGSGDMLKSVYDTNNNGIVDNAEALGGVPASDYAKSADVQPTLESGVNIKTINGNSILGPGNIEIQGGSGTVDTEMSDSSTNAVQNKVIKAYVDTSAGTKQDTLVSGTNIKTINNQSLLGNGNIDISGGSGTVDTTMSDTSENAVQNKVIKEYVDGKAIKIFTLTGSYGSTNTNMTADDLATVKDACDFYLAGGFPLIDGAGDGFFLPHYVDSNTRAKFLKSYMTENSGQIAQREISYNGSNGYVQRNTALPTGGECYIQQTQIDDLDKLEENFWRGAKYMIKGIFQFTLTIKQGSTVKKRYSGIMVGDFNATYTMCRYFSPDDSYTFYTNSSTSGGQVFQLRDDTNRGSLDCSIFANGVTPFDINFRNKNKTVSGNSIYIEGMVWSLL